MCLAVVIVSAEFLLRWMGHLPYQARDSAVNPVGMYAPDPVVGWKNREGRYPVFGYADAAREVAFPTGGTWTILSGGIRSAGEKGIGAGPKVVIVGGSYTQGYGVSDDETYPWKLNSQYPFIDILNYGTSGYGTYQSLLTLEQIFSDSISPRMVLYGFIEHHEFRNVAPSEWLEAIGRKYNSLPYCTVDSSDKLVRHPPEGYPAWPLSEKLAFSNFAQKQYMRLKAIGRSSQKRKVTEKLLVEMNNLSERNGAEFAVVLLSCKSETKAHYERFFAQNNIEYVDCVHSLTPDKHLNWDRLHPNAAMNSIWAECIGDAVNSRVVQFGR